MEQIVTVKLRVVVAGIPMSKRVALAGDGILTRRRWSTRGAGRASPVLSVTPRPALSTKNSKAACLPVNHNEPACAARISISSIKHSHHICRQQGLVSKRTRSRTDSTLQPILDVPAGCPFEVQSSHPKSWQYARYQTSK